jgi:Uma2 family endonuclease
MVFDVKAGAKKLVTWEEFIELPDDDLRELVDGVLLEQPVPSQAHERITALLIYYLQTWVLPRQAGCVLASHYKVKVTDARGVMPDIQYLANETWKIAGEKGLTEGRPELVVEVVSPSNRRHDRVRKLDWYAAIGVPEYWLVDPEERTIERLLLTGDQYRIAQTATDGVFRPASFEGLEIPLDLLWAKGPSP